MTFTITISDIDTDCIGFIIGKNGDKLKTMKKQFKHSAVFYTKDTHSFVITTTSKEQGDKMKALLYKEEEVWSKMMQTQFENSQYVQNNPIKISYNDCIKMKKQEKLKSFQSYKEVTKVPVSVPASQSFNYDSENFPTFSKSVEPVKSIWNKLDKPVEPVKQVEPAKPVEPIKPLEPFKISKSVKKTSKNRKLDSIKTQNAFSCLSDSSDIATYA